MPHSATRLELRVQLLSSGSQPQTPSNDDSRGSSQSLQAPGSRRQRRVSHLNRPRVSQTTISRKKREARHSMSSAPITLTVPRDHSLAPLREVRGESGGYFDKVCTNLVPRACDPYCLRSKWSPSDNKLVQVLFQFALHLTSKIVCC